MTKSDTNLVNLLDTSPRLCSGLSPHFITSFSPSLPLYSLLILFLFSSSQCNSLNVMCFNFNKPPSYILPPHFLRLKANKNGIIYIHFFVSKKKREKILNRKIRIKEKREQEKKKKKKREK